jgi:regulator of sirC expression with transglutaminase-like and TPR domain
LGTPLSDLNDAFIREVSLPDEDIDLLRAGLYLAASEYPKLDIVACEGQVALLAGRAKNRLSGRANFYDTIHAINTVLFEEEGFRGNSETYYDPRNSYLNDVIHNRAGVPISLSVLYMTIAGKLGQKFRGIGMPAHFLVAAGQGPSEVFIDPFNRGGLLSRREALQMALRGRDAPNERMAVLARRFLPVFDKRMILRRMLNNLKQIFLKEKDNVRALRVAERIHVLEPEDWRNLSDLARLQTELGRFSDAAASLSAFIERAPAGTDVQLAENALRQLKGLAGGQSAQGATNG